MSPYEDTLKTLLDTCGRYDAALVAVPDAAVGGSPWTPIYNDLLAQLREALEQAVRAYEAAADEAGISAADRYDWKLVLHNS